MFLFYLIKSYFNVMSIVYKCEGIRKKYCLEIMNDFYNVFSVNLELQKIYRIFLEFFLFYLFTWTIDTVYKCLFLMNPHIQFKLHLKILLCFKKKITHHIFFPHIPLMYTYAQLQADIS